MKRYDLLSPLTDPKDFNARIRFVRTRLCSPPLTQTEMAKALELSFRMYQEFEITKRAPRAETIARLVRYFEQNYPARRIDLRWLLLGEGEGTVNELAAVVQNGLVVDVSAALQKMIGLKSNKIIGARREVFLTFDSKKFLDDHVDEESESEYPVTLLGANNQRLELLASPKNITYRCKPARLLILHPRLSAQSKSAGGKKNRA